MNDVMELVSSSLRYGTSHWNRHQFVLPVGFFVFHLFTLVLLGLSAGRSWGIRLITLGFKYIQDKICFPNTLKNRFVILDAIFREASWPNRQNLELHNKFN